MAKVEKLARAIKDTEFMESKGETDTIRLWENYRDQALLWRAMALLQIPTSLLLVVFSVILWTTRSVTLNVPAKPWRGVYLAKEIPDIEFVEVATNFINLIATYQPAVARRQFEHARQYLRDPILERFDLEMMNVELKAIENTNRTQIYFPDPNKTKLERPNDKLAIVSFSGDRLKLVAGKELPAVNTTFTVSMTTIPRQELNPYGIVIVNVTYENDLRGQDK
jgi:hypothetical protein